MKTEVYSWRVSSDLKSSLEREARRRKQSLSAVLDLAVRKWLESEKSKSDEEEQRRMHQAMSKYIGAIAGNGERRSERVRELVRARLMEKRARRNAG